MQPTVTPWAWVSSWERRARTRAAGEYARPRDRAQPARHTDKYDFNGLRKDSRQYIRLDPLTKHLLLRHQWPPTNSPAVFGVDRFQSWVVPDIKVPPPPVQSSLQSYGPYEPVSIVLPASGQQTAPASGMGHSRGAVPGGLQAWTSAMRGWAAGAVLLALLVLIVRAAENCLHKKLFKAIYMHTNAGAAEHEQETLRGQYRLRGVRRQESDEWSTPNVMATSQQQQNCPAESAGEEDVESGVRSDMPPPYSHCSDKRGGDDLPPPYSSCVTYQPSSPPTDLTNVQNVRNDLIEHGIAAEPLTVTITTSSVDYNSRMELVFDNGRIVERSSDPNSDDTGKAANDDVGDQSTGQAKDKEVHGDETRSGEDARGRILLV